MKPGTLIIILIVLAYVGFEAYAVSKVAYRMEPLYIFERFVAVDRGMSRCGDAGAKMRNRFSRNREVVQQRARDELVEQNPSASSETIDRLLTEIIQGQESTVDALIAELGCGDIEIFKLTKGYENRSRLNVAGPARNSGS